MCKCDKCAGTNKHNVVYEIHRNTCTSLWDTIQRAWSAQHRTILIHYSKMRNMHENMYIKHHISNVNKNHGTNSNTNTQPIFETTYITKSTNNLKIQESRAIIMKYSAKIRKPIPFSWRLKTKWWATMEVFVSNTVGLREEQTGKTMNSHKSSRENWKVFKKTALKAQDTRFMQLNQMRASR